MTSAYKILSAVYRTLAGIADLTDIVGERIYTQAQMPEDAAHPTLHLFIRTATEKTNVGALSDVFIDLVARSNNPDGEGSELANIFIAADAVLNGVFHRSADGSASGRLSRAGMSVGYGTYDEEQKDYFKRWTYRVIVKYNPQT